MALALLGVSCQAVVLGTPTLTRNDLETVFWQAADRAREFSIDAVIAVVDRDGRAILVRRASGDMNVSARERAIAVSKAGTAVFLSSNAHAFSSRTAGFIIQPRFPPRVRNRPPGPLIGVGFSNLAFSDINHFRELDGSRIPGTRLYASPGGVPLFKEGELLAGIGVTGDGTEQEDDSIEGADTDEAVALAGQIGFAPNIGIFGSNVFIDGIRLPYVASEARPASLVRARSDITIPAPPPPIVWPGAVLGEVAGQLRAPIRGDPAAGLINGQPRLTADEVRTILSNAAARARLTRAGIRLPAGQAAQVFIAVVSNPARDGQPPAVLGVFRTPDATVFSWDVAVQKARTAVFFSNHARAYSSRTVGFLAQENYPPGLENQPPGPFFGLQERFASPVLTGAGGVNPNLPNGITVFPGGFPLYRNGVLVGAIGISGDGIDQDDLIGAAGTEGFQPAPGIRADFQEYLSARLPYAKFPRDPELRPALAPSTWSSASESGDLPPGSMLNFSARGWASGGIPLIVGFAAQGGADLPAMLLRGAGPALVDHNVEDALAKPVLTLNDSAGHALADNAGWSDAGDAVALRAAMARAGAFPFREGSADVALLTPAREGAYTMIFGGRDGASGTVLAEIYDTGGTYRRANLTNLSVRGRVSIQSRLLAAGFVIAPGSPRNLLIRGIGPSLAAFGVEQPLARPRLVLRNASGEVIAEGAPWAIGSNAVEVESAARSIGAFPLAAIASDPVLLVTLQPGAYTVQLVAAEGEGGEALGEIYALP